jgi:aryl-alcohol dehydrogenase-like predicted oxidoreductase
MVRPLGRPNRRPEVHPESSVHRATRPVLLAIPRRSYEQKWNAQSNSQTLWPQYHARIGRGYVAGVGGVRVEVRRLGMQGLVVSQMGLGCMNLSLGYGGAPSQEQALGVLARALELGVTLFDTAEMYGPFTNEVLVGKGLRRLRDRAVICTKFGYKIPRDGGRAVGVDSRPDHIREVCDASLTRLGIETIDLLYQHRVDPAVPIEDVAGTVAALVRQGKVRYFGLSEAGPDTIRRAHKVFPVTALQTEYSLWTRDPEQHILPVCRELGIGFVAYSPLGRGFLAGAARQMAANDYRHSQPRWQGEALASNMILMDTLTALSQQKGTTCAQLALAWLLHQGPDIVPIPGTGKITRLEENVSATRISLSPEELAAIDEAMPAGAVQGERYDEGGLALIEH